MGQSLTHLLVHAIFSGRPHETENKVRLGVPEDRSPVRLKENALEFDCSAFYGTTARGRPAVSLCRICFAADQDSHFHLGGDFAP